MKCKAKKAFFAGKNDIYHRWKEVKKLYRISLWKTSRWQIPIHTLPKQCWMQ